MWQHCIRPVLEPWDRGRNSQGRRKEEWMMVAMNEKRQKKAGSIGISLFQKILRRPPMENDRRIFPFSHIFFTFRRFSTFFSYPQVRLVLGFSPILPVSNTLLNWHSISRWVRHYLDTHTRRLSDLKWPRILVVTGSIPVGGHCMNAVVRSPPKPVGLALRSSPALCSPMFTQW